MQLTLTPMYMDCMHNNAIYFIIYENRVTVSRYHQLSYIVEFNKTIKAFSC